MSTICYDGFDDGLLASNWTVSGAYISTSSYNRFGSILDFDTSYSYVIKTIPTADRDDVITMGCWMLWTVFPTVGQTANFGDFRFSADSGATHHIELRATAAGEYAVYRGTTLLGTTDVIFPAANVGKYIEVQLTLHDSAGTVDILVDGTSVLSLSSQDTKNGGTATVFDTIRIGNTTTTTAARTRANIDDFYLTNEQGSVRTGFLGPVVIETLFPDGDGNHTDFTRNTGATDWEAVDETAPDGDTTYLESTTATDRSSFTYGALTETVGDILGVQVSSVMRNTGAAEDAQNFVRVSSTNYDAATQAVPASYGPLHDIWEQNPDTGPADWTITEVNALEAGVENI